MKCTLCGHVFDPAGAEAACKHCPIRKGCKLIRCPNCGFETPPEPEWFKRCKKETAREKTRKEN